MLRAYRIKKNYCNFPIKKRPVHITDFQDDEPNEVEHRDLSSRFDALRAKGNPGSQVAIELPMDQVNLNAPCEASSAVYQPPFTLPLGSSYPVEMSHHPHYPSVVPYYTTASQSPPYLQLPLPPHRDGVVSLPAHVGFCAAFLPRTAAHSGLSLTSPSSSNQSSSSIPVYLPLTTTPEDLLSPGNVASSGILNRAGNRAPFSSVPSGTKHYSNATSARSSSNSPHYHCPDCKKRYCTYSGLSKHQQFHCVYGDTLSKRQSFSCKHCDKVHVSRGALNRHIRTTHTLPCKCPLCGRVFAWQSLVKSHIRTHTGERPFSCEHCQLAFAKKSNLQVHLQVHTDAKKYKCPVCCKTFSRKYNLTRHTATACH